MRRCIMQECSGDIYFAAKKLKLFVRSTGCYEIDRDDIGTIEQATGKRIVEYRYTTCYDIPDRRRATWTMLVFADDPRVAEQPRYNATAERNDLVW